MSIVTVKVRIVGVPPGLLQQSKGVMIADEEKSGKGITRTPEQEAALRCHWLQSGKKKTCSIPWVAVYKSLCTAASDFKIRGRKSAGTLIAATVSCADDLISIGTDQFETYIEFVRIPPRTGALVRIGRPRFREWSADFALIVDAEMYDKGDVGIIRKIMEHSGKMVGIGAWRPQLKGPYGRFLVEKFEVN